MRKFDIKLALYNGEFKSEETVLNKKRLYKD